MQTIQQLNENAARMRSQPTKSETVAITTLAANTKLDFITQVVFGFYILDIVIPGKLLIIEIDGSTHTTPEQKNYDKNRDAFCMAHGMRVLRIPNELAITIAQRIKSFSDVQDSQLLWTKALASANRIKLQNEKQENRKQKRTEGIKFTQALTDDTTGYSGAELRKALKALEVPKASSKPRKKTPENREQRILEGQIRLLAKKAKRAAKKNKE